MLNSSAKPFISTRLNICVHCVSRNNYNNFDNYMYNCPFQRKLAIQRHRANYHTAKLCIRQQKSTIIRSSSDVKSRIHPSAIKSNTFNIPIIRTQSAPCTTSHKFIAGDVGRINIKNIMRIYRLTFHQIDQVKEMQNLFNKEVNEENCYPSPMGYNGIKIKDDGSLIFSGHENENNNPLFKMTFKYIQKIHILCMSLHHLKHNSPTYFGNRVLYIDPYEISWAIQLHLYNSYFDKKYFVTMKGSLVIVHFKVLQSLISDALNKTLASPENKAWVYCVINDNI
jgi:hypothetical protein